MATEGITLKSNRSVSRWSACRPGGTQTEAAVDSRGYPGLRRMLSSMQHDVNARLILVCVCAQYPTRTHGDGSTDGECGYQVHQ